MISENSIKNFNDTIEERKLTIFCGESITAGLLASTIASVSDASRVLKGSIVSYNKEVKTNILQVPSELIEKYTAESQETTTAMCHGLKIVYPHASIYVAVTGVASGSTPTYTVTKEVGQIYVSILYKGELSEFNTIIPSGNGTVNEIRNKIREKTVEYILERIEEVTR
jgi:nicotinamide-nucleotide amidase